MLPPLDDADPLLTSHGITATKTAEMRWCIDDHRPNFQHEEGEEDTFICCPSCGNTFQLRHHQVTQVGGGLRDLPAGVKFDPSDQEILQHLEAKVLGDPRRLHPLIDEFIPTIDGVSKDGQVRHFFYRPSRAYTTGTRKRRRVDTDADGGETRWHKTGKTRPVSSAGKLKGYKKILVLYTNYGRQKKPEKTNWVMHQYHLGDNEQENDGELVISKVFYQTQPRHCGKSGDTTECIVNYYKDAAATAFISCDDDDGMAPTMRDYIVHGGGGGAPFIGVTSTGSKPKIS